MADQAASPTDPAPTAAAPALTGARRGAFAAYQGLLVFFLVLGVVQVFLAGFGVWVLDQKVGNEGETALDSHRTMGVIMGVVALLILLAALAARSSGQAIGLSFVLFLLTFPVQSVLAHAGEDTAFLGGLHTVDAFVILGLAGYLHRSAGRPRRAATA
jgi:small-conductance mechanosensitive channel